MHQIIEELQNELDRYHDDSIVDNRSRMIVHDKKYIYLYLKESGVTETADYSKDLYHFMARPSCCSYSYDYQKDRVQIEIMEHWREGKRYKPTLGGFVQRWYRNKRPLDEFIAEVVNETRVLSVDHANADRHNHCSWNLSDVTTSQNSKKNALAFRVKPPYFCYIAVTPENEYRVTWGYEGGFLYGEWQYWICRNMDALIDLLQAIMNMPKPPARIRHSGTPKEIWEREPGALCASENFIETARYAERLLNMHEDEFAEWVIKKA